MAIFDGVVKGIGNVADKLGFSFITGNVPLVPPAPIYIGMQIEDLTPGGPINRVGGFSLNVPNHSAEYGELAINMAQESLVLIELAIALQSISDPKGGIRIKDALDPYHYNVVKNALEENNEPVPEPANPGATILTKLGGTITETGALSAVATGAQAMKTAGFFSDYLKFSPQIMPDGFVAGAPGLGGGISFNPGTVGTPPLFQVAGFWPNYSLPLNIMSSAVIIKTIILQYIVSLIRNSIDTKAGAILLKNVLDDFSVAVSKNAIEKANGEPPDATVQEGEEGIF